MRCPYCKADDDRVIDSRTSADGFAIRRRRVCRACGRRYTTYERVESAPLRVVKKNGERVEFDRAKVMGGLSRAVEKRPVSVAQLEALVDRVERQVVEAFDREVPSKVIGELVMHELQRLDQVAYVRFASVYRDFKDVGQFLDELKPMLERQPDVEPTARVRPGRGSRADGGGAVFDGESDLDEPADGQLSEGHGGQSG
jgi:transcriptional repressor NrdR